MDNQMYRVSVQDLAKKRRDYLSKKSGGLSFAYLLGFCAAAAGLITPLAFLGAMLYDNCMEGEDGVPAPTGIDKLTDEYPMLVPAAFGVFALGGGLLSSFTFKKTKSLPYVPPVDEQIAALRAEEILLRASDEPSATPDELLRAASSAIAEPAEELLRADEGRAI
jgi:hypothetical protein